MNNKKIEPYKGIAVIYDEIRPSYPQSLIEDVISKANLKPNSVLLEIGAGTGKATVQFAEKGYKIDAVEIGEDMAEVFRTKCSDYPKVSLDVASFEDWKSRNDSKYDMIYSAQAFHWLDVNIKYKKCYELLKDDGYLVLFWYNACSDESPKTKEIEENVEKIIQKYTSKYSSDTGKPQRREHCSAITQDERKAEIEASGLFELVEKIEYTEEIREDAKKYLNAKKSVPAFASILDKLENSVIEKMDGEIEELINKYGGYVGTMFEFSLYIAKKI